MDEGGGGQSTRLSTSPANLSSSLYLSTPSPPGQYHGRNLTDVINTEHINKKYRQSHPPSSGKLVKRKSVRSQVSVLSVCSFLILQFPTSSCQKQFEQSLTCSRPWRERRLSSSSCRIRSVLPHVHAQRSRLFLTVDASFSSLQFLDNVLDQLKGNLSEDVVAISCIKVRPLASFAFPPVTSFSLR